MKVIDQNNIDEWFFDYFEGNLSTEEVSRLFHFLKENPSLQQDYEAWKSTYLQSSPMLYPGVKQLLKPRGFFHSSKLKWILGSFLICIAASYIYLHYSGRFDEIPVIREPHDHHNTAKIRIDPVFTTSKDTFSTDERKEKPSPQINQKTAKRERKTNKLPVSTDTSAAKTDTLNPGKIHFFVPKLPPEVLKEIMYIKGEKLNQNGIHKGHDSDQEKLHVDSTNRQKD